MTQTKPSPLSDTQLVILTTAAAREDCRVLPPPASLKARGGALKQALGAMLKAGLIAETAAGRDDAVWRIDENEGRLTLAVTRDGLAMIGLDDGSVQSDLPAMTDINDSVDSSGGIPRTTQPTGSAAGRTGRAKRSGKTGMEGGSERRERDGPTGARRPGKAATVMDMLRSTDGVSIEALMAATGWQAHSVRGFLSGTVKKKLGLTVASEKRDGVRHYRIPA